MNLLVLIACTAAFLCGGMAVFVFLKEKRSFLTLAFGAGMLGLAAEAGLSGLSFGASLPAEIADWQRLRLMAGAFVSVTWLLFSLGFGRTNYKDIIKKWQWYILPILAVPFALLTFFRGSIFDGLPVRDATSQWLIPLGWSGYLLYLVLLIAAILILANVERALRNSSGSVRWQIKFMILGIGGIFAARVYTGSQVLLFNCVDVPLEVITTATLLIGDILIILSLVRLRLLRVEIYPSQYLIYNSVTVIIVGFYLAVIGVLANLASYLGISDSFLVETLIIFLSCLGLAAILLSTKLRQGVKRFINVHLKRPKYDYRRIWILFAQRTGHLVEVREVCTVVTKMVVETFGVPCVTIWLLDDSGEKLLLGGSTVFSPEEIKGLQRDGKAIGEFIKVMRNAEMPVDFHQEKGRLTVGREVKSRYLLDARIRYGVSLSCSKEFLGIMTLNDKITKEEFSLEDFDLLKAIADQTAVTILNLRISELVRQRKETEWLQTISTFFLHDLKNLSSGLSMTMQNLPIHFDNREFRDDAIRLTQQNVNKINNICSGLSSLSQKIELKKEKMNPNVIVHSTCSMLNGILKGSPLQDLKPVPDILIDAEQVRKVLTNLLINANEAMGIEGEIRVGTEQKDGWVCLWVSDKGCGMSRNFIEQSLFRPFKTTKKQGMGIGLFQSKMIIEAHGGRIEVESKEGRGTTFRVFLPLAGK